MTFPRIMLLFGLASSQDCTDWAALGDKMQDYVAFARNNPELHLLPSVPSSSLTPHAWPNPMPSVYYDKYAPLITSFNSTECNAFKNACDVSTVWPNVTVGPQVTGSGLFLPDKTYCRVAVNDITVILTCFYARTFLFR
jgi:hypothetical protein